MKKVICAIILVWVAMSSCTKNQMKPAGGVAGQPIKQLAVPQESLQPGS